MCPSLAAQRGPSHPHAEPGPRVLFDKLFGMFLFEIYCLANRSKSKLQPKQLLKQPTTVRIQAWHMGSIWTRQKLDSQRWGKKRLFITGFNGVRMGVYGVRVGYARVAENRVRTDFVQGFTMCVRVSFRVLWCPYGFSMGSSATPKRGLDLQWSGLAMVFFHSKIWKYVNKVEQKWKIWTKWKNMKNNIKNISKKIKKNPKYLKIISQKISKYL